MTSNERFSLILTAISVVGIPTLVIAFRTMVKWTRVLSTLENLVDDVTKLVEDKDKVHKTIFETLKDDRAATDKRLRWLEEYVWKKGRVPDG